MFCTFGIQQVPLLLAIICGTVAVTLTTMTTYNTKKRNEEKEEMTTKCIMRPPTADITDFPIKEMSLATSDIEQFKVCFPMIKKHILEYMKDENHALNESIQWLDDMMEYNVPGGKLNRGTTVLNVYMTIQKANFGRTNITEYEKIRACILGWCIEFLQAFFLVADDIMDHSETRRGQPCYYKKPNIDMIAINDSFILESFVFLILRQYFKNDSYYIDLIELMIDVIQKTEMGQLLDLTTSTTIPITGMNEINFEHFTIERHANIVQYKTAYYSFYLPVAMGMLLSNIRNIEAYTVSKKICCLMGEYFQIQDDYLDCYGNPEVIGKIGTDIQDNKCSWLIVQALNICNEKQRQILKDNYGQNDPKKIQIVKNLYKELNMEQLYLKYEENSYQQIQNELRTQIKAVPNLPSEVFEILLAKIYKRSK